MYIQYDTAPKFKQLLTELQDYLTIPINEYYDHYFNINTADTQGLDNWGVILNQSRTIYTYDYSGVLGFNNGTPPDPLTTGYPQNLNNGNFFSYIQSPFVLNDDQYRIVLKLIYLRYTVNNTVWSCMNVVNQYIKQQYPTNPTYQCVIIEYNMKFAYSFNFTLQPFEIALFQTNQLLPKPAGVAYKVLWT